METSGIFADTCMKGISCSIDCNCLLSSGFCCQDFQFFGISGAHYYGLEHSHHAPGKVHSDPDFEYLWDMYWLSQ